MSSKILIIDDEEIIRNLLIRFFERSGFLPFQAENGFEGVQKAKKIRPDLVILDILMPKMDGYATARKLRQCAFLKDVPIIFLSAACSGKETDAGGEGRELFMMKPVGFNKLMDAVQRMTAPSQNG